MLPARIPERSAELEKKPTENQKPHQFESLGAQAFDASMFHGEPRIVDQIGANIYKYPAFLRIFGLLALSVGLWMLLYWGCSALLSLV